MLQFPSFQQAQSFQKYSTAKFLEIDRTTAPGSEQLDLRIHAISTTLSKLEGKKREAYRKSEVEDELEGELPELFEEDVAEDDEARADEGEAGRSGIDGSQHSPIVRRQTSGDLPRRRHFLLSVCSALIVTIQSRQSVDNRPSAPVSVGSFTSSQSRENRNGTACRSGPVVQIFVRCIFLTLLPGFESPWFYPLRY